MVNNSNNSNKKGIMKVTGHAVDTKHDLNCKCPVTGFGFDLSIPKFFEGKDIEITASWENNEIEHVQFKKLKEN